MWWWQTDDIRASTWIDEQMSMKDEFEAVGHSMHSFQYVSEWLTASPSSEEYSFPCISHPLCLSGSLSLSPPLPSLPLPASHSLHLFSPTFSSSPFPALYLFLTLISPPHFSLFHSFSVNTEGNAVCGRLWLCGCWYLRLCCGVSDFHLCLEWDCARTSVCFLHVLFTACRDLALSSVSDKRARSSSLGDWERVCCCAARGKKKKKKEIDCFL